MTKKQFNRMVKRIDKKFGVTGIYNVDTASVDSCTWEYDRGDKPKVYLRFQAWYKGDKHRIPELSCWTVCGECDRAVDDDVRRKDYGGNYMDIVDDMIKEKGGI